MAIIHHIRKGLPLEDPELKERIGVLGYSMLELAALSIPIVPGFVIEIAGLDQIPKSAVRKALDEGIQEIEKSTDRKLGDTQSPLILKAFLSPSIIAETVPTIANIGLNNPIIQSVADTFHPKGVFDTYQTFLETMAIQCLGFTKENLDSQKASASSQDGKAICNKYLSGVLKEFPQNPYSQLELAVYQLAKEYYEDPLNSDIPAAVVVQAVPHGDASGRLITGTFTTRNIKNGDPQLQGYFSNAEFLESPAEQQDLNELDTETLDDFDEIAGILEGFYLDVRQVAFKVEKGNAYVAGEAGVIQKSVTTKLTILSDFKSENQITDEEYIRSITSNELNSLLFSTINEQSVEGYTVVRGGIAGSLGATTGRVFFSTKNLIEAYWQAKANESDQRLILLQKSTYAEDVQAVEIGCGVITSDGGYTSHAPIVARSLGKPAIVYPEIEYHDGYVSIGGQQIQEGDYLSMEIVSAEEPAIYLGKAELEYPDIEKNGVKDLLDAAKSFSRGIKILANADNPEEASQAKFLGADGIGLCRTEHMFLKDKRIYHFRDLLITKNRERKPEILKTIKEFLKDDFVKLFEIMDGMPITIRLLDAPLHEFLPTSEEELTKTLNQLPELASEQSIEEVRQSFLRLKETNPMLGHRGCRVGISSPEIYDVQTMAILEAALNVKTEKSIEVQPGIMIPLIMSKEEMYLIKNGQIIEGKESVKGIIGVIREFMRENNLTRQPFEVKIGAMIELPAAAISASEIAKQAEFFSFGTNDLTQTTMGLSRDDINSFLPAYTEMDVWKSDPFQNLLDPVKALIDRAIRSGRQVRPDLLTGICGEHGANPEVIRYCLKIGMNYISCSPFGIPVAILAVAHSNLDAEQNFN